MSEKRAGEETMDDLLGLIEEAVRAAKLLRTRDTSEREALEKIAAFPDDISRLGHTHAVTARDIAREALEGG